MAPTQSLTVDDIELGRFLFWGEPIEARDAVFARLRAAQPVAYHSRLDHLPGTPTPRGFWSVTTFAGVREVSRNPHLFSSADGIRVDESIDPAFDDHFRSIISMDDPRHMKLRLVVQAGFTPKSIAKIEASVRERAHRLVMEAKERGGTMDFVETFSAPLPLQVICDMLGIPPADEQQLFEWTNVINGIGDPDYGISLETLGAAIAALDTYALELGRDRRAHPRDDIASTLLSTEVDGERLTDREFANFFSLLIGAGNETTRNAISWGAKLLTDHPDQREQLRADYQAQSLGAADEIVRWSSPVIHMRRVATEDTVLGGQEIAAGDKVVMWYWSANRDEAVFPDGATFDIHRPNVKDQVGYGSCGPHFCLGANLARREIQVMFDEILRELPNLEVVDEPTRLMSSFLNGIKRMPCTV
jgi:methyl-branched lipid omega-hydroxylase